jgi:hypothetical protein
MEMDELTFADLAPEIIAQIKAFESQLNNNTDRRIVLLAYEGKSLVEDYRA